MDSSVKEQALSPDGLMLPSHTEDISVHRAVAFPHENDVHEEKIPHASRSKGVEMKRNLTQEEIDLAAAGYEHLDEKKTKKGSVPADINNVDIHEHRLPFADLEHALKTSIDVKEAVHSFGLSLQDASSRLQQFGRNVLTPPKKKSALRKVFPAPQSKIEPMIDYLCQFLDRLFTMFNILLILAGVLEYVLLGIDFKARWTDQRDDGARADVLFLTGKLCEFLSGRDLDLGGIH